MSKFSKFAVVLVAVVVAFGVSYRFASAKSATVAQPPIPALAEAVNAAPGADGAACACCGTSGSSEPVEGAAVVEGDVQRITVDTANGTYAPNVIRLKAGVPSEITFKAAQGCLGQVMSKPLGFFEDLTTGDKTVRLDGLQAGEYEFSCGMTMVFGKIVVE